MLTIKNYYLAQSGDGKQFINFELVGNIEVFQSNSGKFYVDIKKCKMPTRLDEATAKLMIGKQISGTIVKKECAAYEYAIPATGEVVTLTHRYEYEP
ncbi:hypothetical protein LX64_02948 [Chitinophaga skermanii]|uniref:Uncharacterized protein n=1 Tax=Chitinophaga skermanii TaxID=331697 RepID=A0A327QID5_9BACT|nr:hypothetical protein [Chitinophaga skermanii]RAJ04071.1 hypothetical protein LX64_02948 [Chitinophaga skermanii]